MAAYPSWTPPTTVERVRMVDDDDDDDDEERASQAPTLLCSEDYVPATPPRAAPRTQLSPPVLVRRERRAPGAPVRIATGRLGGSGKRRRTGRHTVRPDPTGFTREARRPEPCTDSELSGEEDHDEDDEEDYDGWVERMFENDMYCLSAFVNDEAEG